MAEILEQVKTDPRNAFVHYRLAMSMDNLAKSRNAYRVVRMVIHPVGAILGIAIGTALKAFDSTSIDPKKLSLIYCVRAAQISLETSGFNHRQALVFGAASLNLSSYEDNPELWRSRARKAFSASLMHTDNAFVAADASLGLMQILNSEGLEKIGNDYRQFAVSMNSRSSLLGYPAGSGPSIWDVSSKPFALEERLRQTFKHVGSQQLGRTQKLLARGYNSLTS